MPNDHWCTNGGRRDIDQFLMALRQIVDVGDRIATALEAHQGTGAEEPSVAALVKQAWTEGVAAGSDRIGVGKFGTGKKVKVRFKDSKAGKELAAWLAE